MILKLLIALYRWLWNLPPIDATNEMFDLIVFFSAMIDIAVIIGIIGMIIIKYTDR